MQCVQLFEFRLSHCGSAHPAASACNDPATWGAVMQPAVEHKIAANDLCRYLPRMLMRYLQTFKRARGPTPELSGVNEPRTAERSTKELNTKGQVPQELNGLYIRTGPNAQLPPAGGYHLCAALALVVFCLCYVLPCL
jgi:Retinal pigment epithelial membrane protein